SADINRAPLRVIAVDAVRLFGEANPDFKVKYEGFVAGEGPETLSGDLIVLTEADVWSAPGKYALIPVGNVSAKNYTVTLAPGVLTVLPATPSNLIPRVLQNGYFAAMVDFYRTILADGRS